MKSLFYILRKSIKNGLLELKRKPARLIAYTIFILLISMSMFINSSNKSGNSVLDPGLYKTIAAFVILLFTAPDLYSSINNGATFFRGADINFVFTSPTSPQKILIYGFVKQMYTSFIAVVFILFQGPNLYRFSNIKPYGIIVIVLGLFIMLFFNSILKILLYSIGSKSEKSKIMLRNIFKLLGAALVAAYFIELYIEGSPGKAVSSLMNSSIIPYIPVYGWVREIVMASMYGINSIFFVYIVLTAAAGFLCSYIVFSMNLDYYEDVLASTELRETAIAATRRGEKVIIQPRRKARVRKVEYIKKGQFASAIFWRQMLEYKKTGFGLINTGSVFYAVIAISAGLFSPVKDLSLILGGMIYLQLIFTFAGKWQKDLSNPYIYMLPDHSFKKVIYSTAVDNLKNLIDGGLVFVITGILFKSSLLLILLNIIAFVSIGALFIYGGVLTRRVLGTSNNIVFTSLMRLGVLVIIVLPGIIVFAVLYSLFNSFAGAITAYIVFIVYNLLFSGLIILLGKGVFENIEL
ncbi:MAG: putative ABC exporter domain-containing protein [Bacillota bacterium]|nr:putative ABC exporter domain-containing protein [Bacillota bacterium]